MSSYTTFNENTGNTNTTANFTGLDNGKYYQFRVSAINSEGSGVVALSDKALVSGPPNAVTSLTPTIGANSVSLSWTKPSSSGGKLITGYKIESKLHAETVSDALASLSATAGNGECAVSWVAPTNFGYSDITGYKVEYAVSPYNTWSVATASVNSLTYTVTGLTNGTSYKFRVSVINGVGTSSPTESSIATPQAVPPDPPTSLTVSAGNQQFTGSWTAPTNNGGAAITGYDLLYAPGPSYNSFSTVSFGNTTSYTVLSLTNGTSYKFKVSAKNSAGTGTASALSSAVTPTAFTISSTGGIVTTYTSNSINYTVYEFRYTGGTNGTQTTYTFTVSGSKDAEVFIVGGGGSGGSDGGGGGGGGGVVYDPNITLNSGTYTVKVGNGGDINTNISYFGEKGSDSEITTVPSNAITTNLTLPLKGKGGGAGYPKNKNSANESSADGGSGGGADHSGGTPRPAGDSNQGNTYWNGSSWVAGGHSGGVAYKGGAGGGGAGGAAPDQPANQGETGSRGGHGVDNNWLGDDNGNNKGTGWRNYAAGGGGGHWGGNGGEGGQSASNSSNDTTGSGGGGKGANGQIQTSGYSYNSEHGREHRGGGGGGEGYEGKGNEGQGGSGLVLIRHVT